MISKQPFYSSSIPGPRCWSQLCASDEPQGPWGSDLITLTKGCLCTTEHQKSQSSPASFLDFLRGSYLRSYCDVDSPFCSLLSAYRIPFDESTPRLAQGR